VYQRLGVKEGRMVPLMQTRTQTTEINEEYNGQAYLFQLLLDQISFAIT
jgi:hypothetical protein